MAIIAMVIIPISNAAALSTVLKTRSPHASSHRVRCMPTRTGNTQISAGYSFVGILEKDRTSKIPTLSR
jgi:hypothetical protein